MLNILFVCKDNAVHSQIAECICSFLGNRICKCSSAGIEKQEINSKVSSLLQEIYQVDITKTQFSKKIDELEERYDLVITINTDLDIEAGIVEKWIVSDELNDELIYSIEEKVMLLLHEIKIGEIR